MDYQNILFTVEAGIARLTLNRPDKLNSFTGAMHAELRDALDTIQSDKTIRVLVLTGAGRAFCAGQDLADPEMAIAPASPCRTSATWSKRTTSRWCCACKTCACPPSPR